MDITFDYPDGSERSYLYQWSTGIKLKFSIAAQKVRVDFATVYKDKAIQTECKSNGDTWTCDIPNSVLQNDGEIRAYFVYITASGERTVDEVRIPVRGRKQPEDYIPSSDPDYVSIKELLEELEEAKTAAETSERNALSSETLAKEYADSAKKDLEEIDAKKTEAVEEITNTGEALEEEITLAGTTAVSAVNNAKTGAVSAIAQTGQEQIAAVNQAGTVQIAAVNQTGAEQVTAVETAAAEIIADRDQINENKDNISALTAMGLSVDDEGYVVQTIND